ncbi:MAG: tRNA (adenosine(37)-N6)-dimethylallyltransferase MiaA [Candidatus Omnitrophica bacterium]|nr:tRNA (adenosine(37)-N6)-dimethylallyltransferase MiaA [Candidatus Omnitrophota bacterium]
MTIQLLALVGPTGVGKSEVAVEIARELPSEIVTVDSMQVYRGMDVGTGKPSAAVRLEIPHHGLDLSEPEELFSVARYVESVTPVIEAIRKRGRLPILVGGSGLYFKALMNGGLCGAPPRDSLTRISLEERVEKEGLPALHELLKEKDPLSAQRIHPNDARRIVRALEVFLVSGRTLSAWHGEHAPEGPGRTLHCVGLACGREPLYRKIEARVESFFKEGWLEEARALLPRRLSQTARMALGYRELFEHLSGLRELDETKRLIQRNTRRYAKRQLSWFRHESAVQWIETDGLSAGALCEMILSRRA